MFKAINKTITSLSKAIVETATTIEDTVNLAHNEVTHLSVMQDQRITREKAKLQKLLDK